MNGRGHRILAHALTALLIFASALARADPEGEERPTPPPPNVEIVVVADESSAEVLGARVESWFRDQVASVHSSGTQSLEPSTVLEPTKTQGVRVWVFMLRSGGARVFFSVQEDPPKPPRYLVNDITLEHGLDELGLEHLAQVVFLSAMALWAGSVESTRTEIEASLARVQEGTRPVPEKPPAPPVPPPEPPPPLSEPARHPSHVVQAGFEYGTRLRGEEGMAQSVGTIFNVLVGAKSTKVGAAAHAAVLLPNRPEKGGVELTLFGATLSAGLAATRRVARRLSLEAELGPGIDIVHYEVSAVRDRSLRPKPGRLDARPLVYASAGLRIELGSVTVSLAALLATQLLRTHYDLSDLGNRSVILEPWTLQPGLSLAILL